MLRGFCFLLAMKKRDNLMEMPLLNYTKINAVRPGFASLNYKEQLQAVKIISRVTTM
jgi:hypothetical protein